MEEILQLLRENNLLLKKILAIVELHESEKEVDARTYRDFIVNVTADMFVELLKKDAEMYKKFKDTIKF